MRPLSLILLALLLPLGAFGVTTNSIFNYTNQLWKFTPAAQTGHSWIQPDFDDAGWSNGHSVFATHLNEAPNPAAHSSGARITTQLSTNYNGQYVVTYYYRTKFTITNDPAQATLVISNMVDDGAIFYLNGVEIKRTRIPEGTISNATYATTSVEAGNLNDTFSISFGSDLLAGENTIAVEVHQAPPTPPFGNNNDSLFGLALSLISFEQSPPQITNFQPNISADPGSSVELSVDYQSADPVTFRWYFQGALIPEATNNPLVLPVVNRSHEGAYHVVLSNQWGSVTSSVATLSLNFPVYVPLHSEWKYHFADDPGTNWYSPSFDDSSWSEGPGVFGQEFSGPAASLIRTTLPLTNSQGQSFVTYYFRKPFLATAEADAYVIVVSNLFDDGAIFYLNGQSVFRTNMPSGIVAHGTGATTPVSDAQFSTFQVSPGLLVDGTNWFAVQLAQSGNFSSDVVFGMTAHLAAVTPTFLSITSDLADVTAEEGISVTLQASVNGNGAVTRWYKDGTLIPGVSRNFLNLNGMLDEAGVYFYVASNVINSVTSKVATVSIQEVSTPPFIVSAFLRDDRSIELLFNRPMSSIGISNAANYSISSLAGTQSVPVSSVAMLSPVSVVLQLSQALNAINFQITASNLEDRFGNQITNSPAYLSRSIKFFDFRTNWKFWTRTNAPAGDWTQVDFDDSQWSGARFGFPAFAPFGVSVSNRAKEPDTSISRGPHRITSYFRKDFVVDQISPSGLDAQIFVEVQDGAAFYLNGQEFLRTRLPEGILGFETTALPLLGGSFVEGPFAVPPHLFRIGSNILAVELHQDTPVFDNSWMAASLESTFSSFQGGKIIFTRQPSNTVAAERDFFALDPVALGASTFQWFRNGEVIPGATNSSYWSNEAIIGVHGGDYFMVAANNQFTATSAVATVEILPDLVAPRLLSAYASNNLQEIWLTFSEPLGEASVTNFNNYLFTNFAGASVPISSITWLDNQVVVRSEAPLNPEAWIVRLSGLTDIAFVPNTIDPQAAGAQIGLTHIIVDTSTEWKYLTPTESVNGWQQSDFNDAAWPVGQGIFGEDGTPMPDIIRTRLPLDAISHYFRKVVTIHTTGDLMIKYYIDDGAVFYINGNAVHRVRMPSGQVAWNTSPTGGPPEEGVFEPIVNLGAVLDASQNILAVEVHQSGLSSDVIFAAEFFVQFNSTILAQ